MKELNVDGLKFPMTIEQIPQFEINNTDYAINVIYPNSEDKSFVPLYASPHRNRKHVVNMLLLSDMEKRHYIVIRNLSALLASRNSHGDKSYPCPFCLHCFTTAAGKHAHMPECGTHGLQTLKYPTEDNNFLEFTNTQHEMQMPFVIYADFECFLQKTDEMKGKSTKITHNHEPSGFCCLTVSSFDQYNDQKPVVYSGENVMDVFFKHVKTEQSRITKILNRNEKMKPLNKLQQASFDSCVKCPSCNIDLKSKNKVRHHCHITGNFLSALCSNCNLKYKFKKPTKSKKHKTPNFVIPILFHSLRSYDSHFIFE